jgi:hypothetical protein
MNNPDLISESLETIFVLKYLNSLMRIRDPGWKKFGSGIRDKHPRSGTLIVWLLIDSTPPSLILLLFFCVQEFPERIPRRHPGPRPAAGLQPSAVRLVT